MIGIVEGVGKRIAEDGSSLLEGDAVLSQIRGSFLLIPLETHVWNIATFRLGA